MQFLLENKANPNLGDESNRTALHYLAKSNHWNEEFESCLKILLEHGANINATDDHLNTPLHFAIYHQNLSFAKILMKYR